MRAILLTGSCLALVAAFGVAPTVASDAVASDAVASGFSRTHRVLSDLGRTNSVSRFSWADAARQVPVPFPKPAQPPSGPPQAKPADPPPVPPPAAAAQAPANVPTEETLGAPIYPGAQYITSYDAGRGQRYYLFGTNASYTDIVAYYRNTLRSRGDEVFREPPVHMFDVARFRAETMAFPPSVTVKDYAWGGSQGYLNPTPGAEPGRFRTIIQIVPLPPGVSAR